jgi:hypothetical protein
VFYRSGGKTEIQDLDISTATGNQTLTITLDGTDFDVSTTGTDPTTVAYQIQLASSTFTGWEVQTFESKVVFLAQSVGDKTGTFDVTTTGTFSGTFTEQLSGAANIDTFITQSSWNINTALNDTHGSFVLDPLKGNVYEIKMQYLGYGAITFSIESPSTGDFIDVHQIQYANNNTNPSFDNPIMKVGWFAANAGNTTNISCRGASAEVSLEGPVVPFRNPIGHGNTVSGVTTTLTGLLGICVRGEFADKINLTEVFPLIASFAVDGTKPVDLEIHINPTVSGQENWKYHSEANSIVGVQQTAVTITSGTEIVVSATSRQGSVDVDLKALDIVLLRNDVLYLCAKATSSTTDVAVGLTWRED